MEINELLRIRDRKKMEKYCIHNAENGGVGSNPEGNGKDRNGCENRRLRQLVKGVAETLDGSNHGSTSVLRVAPF